MWVHNLNPVIVNLFGLEIRWYGLMYVLGIMFSYYFILWYIKKKKLKLSQEVISDVIFYGVLGIIIGGRLGYVLFYNPLYYLKNPLEILMFWKGGLSFHGGLIAIVLFTYFYFKKHKLNFLKYADVVVIPIPVALALGRLGNFINGELWGRITNVPWAVVFPAAGNVLRHPSQLYELAKNLLIFGILFFLSRKKRKTGFMLFAFMACYGILRFLVEFVREPEIVFAGITMGQWLSIPLIIIGAFFLIKKRCDP